MSDVFLTDKCTRVRVTIITTVCDWTRTGAIEIIEPDAAAIPPWTATHHCVVLIRPVFITVISYPPVWGGRFSRWLLSRVTELIYTPQTNVNTVGHYENVFVSLRTRALDPRDVYSFITTEIQNALCKRLCRFPDPGGRQTFEFFAFKQCFSFYILYDTRRF